MNYSTTNIISKHFLTLVHILINDERNTGEIRRGLNYYIQNFNTSLKLLNFNTSIKILKM